MRVASLRSCSRHPRSLIRLSWTDDHPLETRETVRAYSTYMTRADFAPLTLATILSLVVIALAFVPTIDQPSNHALPLIAWMHALIG